MKLARRHEVVVTTTTKTTAKITRKDLIEAFDLPPDARITMHVPGGGDWSNTDLTVGEEGDVFVEWEKSTVNGRIEE